MFTVVDPLHQYQKLAFWLLYFNNELPICNYNNNFEQPYKKTLETINENTEAAITRCVR